MAQFQIPTLKKSTIRSRKGLGLELDVAELVRRFLTQQKGMQGEKGLKEKVQLVIDKLTERYGASQAMAIVTSGQAVGWAATVIGTVLTGVPTWIPGSSVWGMAPGIALAEAYRQVYGKGITASRYMLSDLVNEFRHFMERLRNYGIRVPSLSDEQIARTLEAAINESERMEFGGRTRGKSIQTKGADELLRMWQAGPANWTNGEITRNVNQLSNDEATKLGQSMFNDSDKYTRQKIRQAFEHRFESWNRIQFRSMRKSIALPDERQDENWSCGAAAVVSVCRYFSIEPDTESEAIRELGSSPSDGTPPQAIVEVLESHGLATDARDWFDLDALNEKHLKKGHPVLCPIQMYGNPAEYEQAEGGHWVVLTGIWDGKVCLQDPVAGKVEMDVEEFKSRWHDKGADGNPYEQYGIACWKPAIDGMKTFQWKGKSKEAVYNTGFREGYLGTKDRASEYSENFRGDYKRGREDGRKAKEQDEVEKWRTRKSIDYPSVVYTDRWAIPMMKRSPFWARKSLGILTKAEGTCQQGERADLTGCTPASGEGGGSSGGESKPEKKPDDSKQRDIQNVKEALERAKEAGKKKQVEQLQQMLRDLGESEGNKQQVFSSKKEMDKWGKENFSSWEKGLSKEEKKALLQYAGPMFFDTNSSLRSDGSVPEKWKDSVKNLDAAIEKSTIPNDIVAYRGLWLDGKEQSQKFVEKFVPGAILSDPGFMSTSINREIASDFGGEKLGSGIVIEIKVPKGSKGAYMDVLPENAKHFKQNELLLPRGAKFKVVSVEKGKAVVELVNE